MLSNQPTNKYSVTGRLSHALPFPTGVATTGLPPSLCGLRGHAGVRGRLHGQRVHSAHAALGSTAVTQSLLCLDQGQSELCRSWETKQVIAFELKTCWLGRVVDSLFCDDCHGKIINIWCGSSQESATWKTKWDVRFHVRNCSILKRVWSHFWSVKKETFFHGMDNGGPWKDIGKSWSFVSQSLHEPFILVFHAKQTCIIILMGCVSSNTISETISVATQGQGGLTYWVVEGYCCLCVWMCVCVCVFVWICVCFCECVCVYVCVCKSSRSVLLIGQSMCSNPNFVL